MRALAVFHGAGRGLAVRLFCGHRPGFRHCFAALETEAGWLRIDAQAHRTRVELVAPPGYDLAAFYRAAGLTVVETEVREPPCRGLAPIWFSCVETVKRLLGLQRWWIWTPWQLYRALQRGGGRAVRLRADFGVSPPPRPSPVKGEGEHSGRRLISPSPRRGRVGRGWHAEARR